MKYIDEYRNDEEIKKISSLIAKEAGNNEMKFMEVCGTHTMSIARFALTNLLPKKIGLISGPGCPVCVTPAGFVDAAIEIAKKDAVVVSFGDMIRVPGSNLSLQSAKMEGCDIRIVYSPLDAVKIASELRNKQVVFLGVGFETTSPTVAATIKTANGMGLNNFSVLASHKLVPPALKALVDSKIDLNGFILPGHVSVIIGRDSYISLFNMCKIPMAVAGFEPTDILLAIYDLVKQVINKKPSLDSMYTRAVHDSGNKKALDMMYEVFEVCDSHWRGIGLIPESGLRIKDKYSGFDAEKKFGVQIKNLPEPKGCVCGDVLKGVKNPLDCKFFGNKCVPTSPVGPCMVSSEGTCSAYFKYGRKR